MAKVCRIGLDIAKNVFQAHGVDRLGKMVFTRKIQRSGMLLFFTTFLLVSLPLRHAVGLTTGEGSWRNSDMMYVLFRRGR